MNARPSSPIFIGGVAGSGKTRLGALLDHHPSVSVTRKTYLWRRLYGRFGDLSVPANRDRCRDAMLESAGMERLRLDPDQVRAEVERRCPRTYGELFGIVHRMHADRVGKRRWCDQLGLVEVYAGPIFSAYPDAKLIHMVCDPRSLGSTEQPPWTVGWTLGKWLTSAEVAETNRELYPGRCLVVRRETFEDDEEGTMRRVCEFLDETYDDAVAAAVRGEPDTARSMPATESRVIDRRTRHLRALHGYAGGRGGAAAGTQLRTRLVHDPATRVGLAAWQGLRLRSIERQLRCAR